MTVGFLFWLLMVLWFFFGLWIGRDCPPGGRFAAVGGGLLLFTLLFLLGWKTFGFPIQG